MNKKAALELSITAIVVLIIAITVLGLGIGFIKKQFTAGTEIVGQEISRIKEQLREQVKTGGELLVFSVPEEVNVGQPENSFVGVRNTAANPEGDRVCFRIEVKCIKPFTPYTYCDPNTQQNDVAVGGYEYETGLPVTGNNNWFRTILGEFDLRNYEGEVYDAVMLVRGVKPDNYAMEINVYKEPDNRNCANQQFGSRSRQEELYTSKSFTLEVV